MSLTRLTIALLSIAMLLTVFIEWTITFDGTWKVFLAFPLGCAVFGLVIVSGGLVIDRIRHG